MENQEEVKPEPVAKKKPEPKNRYITLAESVQGFKKGNFDAFIERLSLAIKEGNEKGGQRELVLARQEQLSALKKFQQWEAEEEKLLNPVEKPKK